MSESKTDSTVEEKSNSTTDVKVEPKTTKRKNYEDDSSSKPETVNESTLRKNIRSGDWRLKANSLSYTKAEREETVTEFIQTKFNLTAYLDRYFNPNEMDND
jgi:hypothetical protein